MGVEQVDFGGVKENVITRQSYPMQWARERIDGKTISILGQGPQGRGQGLNLRRNGFKVIVGQRSDSPTYQKALDDGWVTGKTLFSLEEAAKRGDIVAYLVSDAAQKELWPKLERYITPGKTLCFSHGFGYHFRDLTGINSGKDVNVIMVAPKGPGQSVLENKCINSSYAIGKDATGDAFDLTVAMAMGINTGYGFETTFKREVLSDHFGERAFLLGEVWAIAQSWYKKLREIDGLSPQQAFINSSEQITQVILPLIGVSGAAEIYRQAEAAGQLGTVLRYETIIRQATQSTLDSLYESVKTGIEAKIALDSNSKPYYREVLNIELDRIDSSEMWSTGRVIRETTRDRTYGLRITNFALAGTILGAMAAQYQTLMDNGHSPSEGLNETVEESTQGLNKHYQKNGVSNLLRVCSTTAQRGALDWGPRFEQVILPQLLKSRASYSKEEGLQNYVRTNPDMWKVGATVIQLRPT